MDIIVEPFEWCTYTNSIVFNSEVCSVLGIDFRMKNMRCYLASFSLYGRRGKGGLAFFRIQQSSCIGVHYDFSVFNGTDWELIKFFIRKSFIMLNQW